MKKAVVVICALALMCLLACSNDDTVKPTPANLFSVTVTNDGNPLPALRVGSINHLHPAPVLKPCPETDINFSLPEASDWQIDITDYYGRLVKTMTGHSEAGTVIVTWDGTDTLGSPVISGFYNYELTAGAFQDDSWMVLELGPDPAQTIIGELDGNGQLNIDDTLLFPCLLGQQPLDVYADTVTIHLSRVDTPDSFFLYTTPLSVHGNSFTFTLDQLGLPEK